MFDRLAGFGRLAGKWTAAATMRAAILLGIVALSPSVQGQSLRCYESRAETGRSAAVAVADVPLVHTAQLLPLDDRGNIVAVGDAGGQVERLFERLTAALHIAGSEPASAVKLNFYLAREDVYEIVNRALAERFKDEPRPAVSLVVTRLPHAGALVALDAVATAAPGPRKEVKHLPQAAILPAGSRIYVSGQAERGTLAEATRKTLASLSATLKHCGRTDANIVQVKCFLQPMASAAEVQHEIARYYGEGRVPPVALVEWSSSAPIEIEVTAWGGPARADAADSLEFITPPGLKASPLFSRVVRIHRGGTIFFSDLHGPPNAEPLAEVEAAYERLRQLCELTGSDLRHLVKTTYYPTDAEITRAQDQVRPKYYDTSRPPASSRALVAGTGRPGVRYVMDMIAVPTQ